MKLFERGARRTATLTNLNQQPYPTPDLSGWTANFATGGAGTRSYEVTGGVYGLPYHRMTWTTASTEVSRGVERVVPAGALTPGVTYTASAWTRNSRTQTMAIVALPTGSNGAGIGSFSGATVGVSSNVWTHHSVTFVAPASSTGINVRLYSTTVSGGTAWQVGDILDATAIVVTEGQPTPYFDGNYAFAKWEGAVGNSRSSTPALYGIYPLSRVAEMGTCVVSTGATGGVNYNIDGGPISSAQPLTQYVAHVAGTTTHRGNFLNNTSSVLAAGRNSGGTGWFALSMNSGGGASTVQVSRTTSANVVAAVREETRLTVHSFAGNTSLPLALTGWPSLTTIDKLNSSSDVRLSELWTGAHAADVRHARMAQIRTLYAIAA